MQSRCDVLVTLTYIVAACTAMLAIHYRCKATVEDVERHCIRQGNWSWYAFKVGYVVVLVGGAMHLRHAVTALLERVWRG